MKKIINTLAFTCLYGTAYMISLLPMRMLYGLSNIVYMVIVHVVPYRKRIVIQNLSRSFPEMNYKAIENTMSAFYRSFTDNFAEILKAISIPFLQQANKLTLINFDVVTEQIKQGKSVIASMGHCGNWEIMNVLPGILQVNSYAVYQPLKAKIVDRLFLTLRSRFGMRLIPATSVARHFLSKKDHPSLYLFLADQCPKSVDDKYRFDFLHQQTSTFPGIEKLAQATGAVVVYMHVLRTARGSYSAECKIISTDSVLIKETEITQNYIHHLERNIQEQPSSWLWTHKRWKR